MCAGKDGGLLNYPDDAHLLADGKFITADIRNCRILIIDPKDNSIATQWGTPGKCRHNPPQELGHPNGATPLDNGDILVTEISGSWISRITRQGQVLWSVQGAQHPLSVGCLHDRGWQAGDRRRFLETRRVVIFDPATRKISWEYFVRNGEGMLDHSSIARELPDTGDIFVVDDLRDRVMVIDRKSKEIIWQYGVTDTKGHKPGYLFYPDGFDIDVFRDWKAVLGKR
jgi:hypothetical protein